MQSWDYPYELQINSRSFIISPPVSNENVKQFKLDGIRDGRSAYDQWWVVTLSGKFNLRSEAQ